MVRRASLPAVWLALIATGCAQGPPALPEPGPLDYHEIPWEDAFPSDVVVDDSGRVWFTDRLTHAVGVFDPATETFDRIPTPTDRSAPYGLTVGPDGALWFGQSNGGRLGRLDPDSGVIREIETGLAAGPQLLAWSGDALWFTDRADDAVGRYAPGTGTLVVWRDRIPEPYGIAATPDGRVWVGSYGGTQLYRVDVLPDSGAVLDFSEPVPPRYTEAELESMPDRVAERIRTRRHHMGFRRLAAGPDGRVWATGYSWGRVVGMAPDTGEKRTLATLDTRTEPYAVAVDPWGRVWYSEKRTDQIVVYDPVRNDRTRFRLPIPGGTVRDIAVDSARGRVWLPMSDAGAIAVIRLRGGSTP